MKNLLPVYVILGVMLIIYLVETVNAKRPGRPMVWYITTETKPEETMPVFTFTIGEEGTPLAGVMYRRGDYWYAWRIPRREAIADIRPTPTWWCDFPTATGKR